jgi:FkbM family methyltransferase
MSKITSVLKKIIPLNVKLKIKSLISEKPKKFFDININRNNLGIDLIKGHKIIRIAKNHEIYLQDIVNSFDYYFNAVVPSSDLGNLVVDYSKPNLHQVVGFEKFKILFPSFAEPLSTTKQYIDFANLKPGMVVFDLGAYSGLTSILFSEKVGSTGKVIAVDADEKNILALKVNVSNYFDFSGVRIEVVEGAMWNHSNGVTFQEEGNMGSSATDILGSHRGKLRKVRSYTLSDLVNIYSLKIVDFIKCDIEGAEEIIFNDEDFFKRFKPKIIIETHIVNNKETTQACIDALSNYGYKCNKIIQDGVDLPLLECVAN